jgi:hypothetical protein
MRRHILDFSFYVLYSTLLNLPPLRFHCVRGCWDPTQGCCDFCIWESHVLTTRLDIIYIRLDLMNCTRLDLILNRLDLMHTIG